MMLDEFIESFSTRITIFFFRADITKHQTESHLKHVADELKVGIIKRQETESEILINNYYNTFMMLSSNRFKYAEQSADQFFISKL